MPESRPIHVRVARKDMQPQRHRRSDKRPFILLVEFKNPVIGMKDSENGCAEPSVRRRAEGLMPDKAVMARASIRTDRTEFDPAVGTQDITQLDIAQRPVKRPLATGNFMPPTHIADQVDVTRRPHVNTPVPVPADDSDGEKCTEIEKKYHESNFQPAVQNSHRNAACHASRHVAAGRSRSRQISAACKSPLRTLPCGKTVRNGRQNRSMPGITGLNFLILLHEEGTIRKMSATERQNLSASSLRQDNTKYPARTVRCRTS